MNLSPRAPLATALLCAVSLIGATCPLCAAATSSSTVRLCFTRKSAINVAALDPATATIANPVKWYDAGRGFAANARIAPDASAVAFTLDLSTDSGPVRRSIAVLDAPGAKPRVLDAIPGSNNYGPIWSPDGTKLMFSHFADSDWHVAVVGRDGAGFRDVTPADSTTSGSFYTGWWAADSKSVFAYDFTNIRHIALDGREISRIPCEKVLGDVSMSSGIDFCLSPDGKRLLFDPEKEVPDVTLPDGPPSIIFLREEGGAQTTAPAAAVGAPTQHPKPKPGDPQPVRVSPKGFCATSPSWLPDGASFVFRRTGRKATDIYQVDLATGKPRLILKDADSPSVSR